MVMDRSKIVFRIFVFLFTIGTYIVSSLNETREGVITILKNMLVISNFFAEILFIVMVIIVCIIISLIVVFIHKFLIKMPVITFFKIIDPANGERITAFQALRDQAKKNVIIMGIGMGSISQDKKRINALLDRGVNIVLLMFDYNCVLDGSKDPSIPCENYNKIPCYPAQYLNEFYVEHNYSNRIKNAEGDIKSIINERKQLRAQLRAQHNEYEGGNIELFRYAYIVPMNVTIIDYDNEKSAKLIVEYCIPFSQNRFISCYIHGEAKKKIITAIVHLKSTAKCIASDRDDVVC